MPDIFKYSVEIFNINIHSYFFSMQFLNIQWKYSKQIFNLFFLPDIFKYLVEIFNINIHSYFFSMQFLNIRCKYSTEIFNFFFWMKVPNIWCKYSTKLYHYIQRYFPHMIFIYTLQIFSMTIVTFPFYAINDIFRANIHLSVTCCILIQCIYIYLQHIA